MPVIGEKIKSYNQRELLKNPKVQSMLKTIRYAEGTAGVDGYGTRVGGGKFTDFSKKPMQKVYIKSINDYSSAEGAYQILDRTWTGVSKKLGLNDFSPKSQDIAAVDLIIQRGAMENILNDDFEGAVTKLSGEWASLPKSGGGSQYKGQKSKTMQDLSKVYYNGKVLADAGNQIQSTMDGFENVTNNNIDFSVPEISGNLATVPDVQTNEENNDDEDVVTIAKDEIQKSQMVQNEEDFINELYANNEQQEQQIETGQEPQKRVETPNTNLLEKYGQIEQFVDTAQQGGQVDMYGNPITAEIQYTDVPRSFYEQRLDKLILGEDYKRMSPEQQEKAIAHENRHSWQQQNGRTNFNLTHNPDYAFNEKLQKQPSVVDTDANWNKYHNRKSMEIGYDLLELKQRNPNLQFLNDDILYDKVLDSQQYDNTHSLEGEAEYYQNTGQKSFQQGGEKNSLWKNIRANRGSGKKPTKQMLEQERKIKRNSQQGGENNIVKDNNGYWNKENWGKPVEIQGGNITMKNVPQPLIGISDKGEVKYMMPEMEYFFKSAKNVTEYPV